MNSANKAKAMAGYLDSNLPYVAYGAARALGNPRAAALKSRLYDDRRVLAVIDELGAWPGPALSSHKSARQFFHKLAFLADIGVEADHPGMPAVIGKVLEHRDGDGIPLLPLTVSEAHGGTGGKDWAWALCDAPTTLYSLLTMGCRDTGIGDAVAALVERRQGDEQGGAWGCVVSEKLGSWRGPGKKSDPCPYATLIMIKLLLAHDPARWADAIAAGAARLLGLWRNSQREHPYMFYMGNDFRKLKLPFIWYDIMHVLDVLRRVPDARADPAFVEMLGLVAGKEQQDGGFVPESVYQEWKDWDFGQKKAPSDWLGLRVAILLG